MRPVLGLPKACILDLDGTLVDSLRDIAEAMNDCLELLGLESRRVDEYRYLVGEGIPVLCQRVLGQTYPHMVARLTELSRARYRARPMQHTRPYPGVSEMVARLKTGGVRLAVLSNKPHDMTVRVVRAFWPGDTFEFIQGYVDEEPRKPDPFHVLRICSWLGVAPAETWLVGDTPVDVQAAARSGAVSLAVTWGFRTRADLEAAGATWIVDQPGEVAVAPSNVDTAGPEAV
jgi:phosphoglycolate phosphatase